MVDRYNTGDPRPSNSMKNLSDNALAFDDFVNSDGDNAVDRFGKEFPTISKLIKNVDEIFSSQLSIQESTFSESQTDKENRFQQFLNTSGYVLLGDYQDGPFQFSARNQYIRYDNQYYRLNAATDVGFTTTGTDATSFASDVTHFVLMDGDTLRQNLGSSEGFIWIGAPASIDGLKQIFPANGARLICKGALTENDGGASWWKFVSGDHRDMVTKYPMLCRAPLADPTGASGVWVNSLDGDLLAHRYGLGISQDPVANGQILRNMLAWNSDINATISEGYGKKIALCGDVIWIDYVEITQSSVHIQGAKGATANQYGGKGTVLMFRDGDSTKPAFTVSGKFTTDESTGRDKVEGRVTGVKLDNLTLVAEQFFKNATPAGKTDPAPTTFTPRSSRLGLVIQYTGGHGGIDGVTSIGFAGNRFNEFWDCEIRSLRIMYSGVSGVTPALEIGSRASDNSNNLNFYQFHMEFCQETLRMNYTRNVHFIGGKIECERAEDSLENVVKLNYAAWEVKFTDVMFVTGHTTLAYFFWNEGIDVGFTDCEWEARNVNASDKYQGIRWYRGNNAINSRNNHTNSMFKKVLPSNGTDDYPIHLGDSESFDGSVVVDTQVTNKNGTATVVNSGLIALSSGAIIKRATLEPNPNAKLAGPLFNFKGVGATVMAVSIKEGQPFYQLATGGKNNHLNANYKFKTAYGSTVPNVWGYSLIALGPTDTAGSISITAFDAPVGVPFTVHRGQGSVTLVNSSVLRLINGANLDLAAGRVYTFVCVNAATGECRQSS
ncbi:TPA: hypothetical protein QHZ51_003226 [Klebsiella quasipneumoniae subsp. similipneumoniae]|nr:hypothetical protein [Klebsiella quasipneumoniae subsp. similipneumoniae]